LLVLDTCEHVIDAAAAMAEEFVCRNATACVAPLASSFSNA